MTRVNSRTSINFETTLTLSECEARALEALIGYGIEPFIETFYKSMGRSFLEPYEGGLRSVFKTIKTEVVPELQVIDKIKGIADKGGNK